MMQPASPMKDNGAIIPKTIKCLQRENNNFIKVVGVFLHLFRVNIFHVMYYSLEKKRKNSKNLKVAGNHPDIYFTQYFKNFRWKIKIINFYYSNY